jgi:hypothetical protein
VVVDTENPFDLSEKSRQESKVPIRSVRKQDLPMATTSLNIVQRLGGTTLRRSLQPFWDGGWE